MNVPDAGEITFQEPLWMIPGRERHWMDIRRTVESGIKEESQQPNLRQSWRCGRKGTAVDRLESC